MKTLLNLFFGLIVGLSFVARPVYSQCAASFTYAAGPNGQINFGSTSTGTSASTTYYWYINGTTISGVGNAFAQASYNYTTNGTYMIYFSYSTPAPTCSTSAQFTVVVSNSTNSCALNSQVVPSQGNNGQVFFNNNSTGNSLATTYTIQFGDGNTGNFSGMPGSMLHTYSVNGTYVSTITANNNFTYACSSTNTAIVTVSSVCNFTANFAYTLNAGGLVTFTSTSIGTNAQTNYGWNFAGLTYSNGINLTQTNYTFLSNGIKSVQLSLASSSPSCNVSTTQTLMISNAVTPTCNLSTNFTAVQGGTGYVSFTSTSTGTAPTSTYLWNFGNGNATGTGPNAGFQYNNNQTYTVSLQVSNNFSIVCIDTKTAAITITNTPCNLVPSMSYTLLPGGVVNFSNTTFTTAPAGVTENWNFGDGTPNSYGSSPQHTYSVNGVYTVYSLLSTFPTSCQAVAVQIISVTSAGNPSCNVSANFSSVVGASGSVAFSNLTTGANNNFIHIWNFGDGIFVNGYSPTHQYLGAGNYIVNLTVTDLTNTLCTSTSTQMVNVNTLPCAANSAFNMVPTNTAQIWNAIPGFPWNVSGAEWSWGDGSTSNQLYTSHTYSAPALYSICLTVTVSCNATSSTCATYSITKYTQEAYIIAVSVIPPQLTQEVSVNEELLNQTDFVLFPNPSGGIVQMHSKLSGTAKINVFDLSGRIVYATTLETGSEINLQTLPNGIYRIEAEQAGQKLNKKLILLKE